MRWILRSEQLKQDYSVKGKPSAEKQYFNEVAILHDDVIK